MAFLSAVLREPLVPFFAVGALLFALDRAMPVPDPDHHITIDGAFVRGLEEEAARRTGHVPDETQTRLGAVKSEGEGAFSLFFERFLPVDGRWVPTSLRFEGRGFSLELRIVEPTIRFL